MSLEADEPIEIVAYDSRWPSWFSDDAAELHEALGASLLALEHVGSTAVPFLAAKPVIFWSPLEPGHYPATTDESSRAWGTNTLVKLAFPVAAARAWRGRY